MMNTISLEQQIILIEHLQQPDPYHAQSPRNDDDERSMTKISFQDQFNQDISQNKFYDSNHLANMITQGKEQYNPETKFNLLNDNEKAIIQTILKITIEQKFKKFKMVIDGKPISLLKIKLLTLKYMEVYLLEYKITCNRDIDFLVCSSLSMALKCYDIQFGQTDMQQWISRQQEKDTHYWSARILKIEKDIFEKLSWCVDLITASDYLNFFLDNHFQDYASVDVKNYCEDLFMECLQEQKEQKWSDFSVVIACLYYTLEKIDQTESNYMKFLINKYKEIFSQSNNIDLDHEEINTVLDFIRSVFDPEAEPDNNSLFDQQEQEENCEDEINQENYDDENQAYMQQLITPKQQSQNAGEQEHIQTQEYRSQIYYHQNEDQEIDMDAVSESTENDERYQKKVSINPFSSHNNDKLNKKRSYGESCLKQDQIVDEDDEQFENTINKKQQLN